MKYIMCARLFPAYHSRAGQETHFAARIKACTKRHTIRRSAGNRVSGDVVSLREWEGKPHRSKQREFAQSKIRLEPITIHLDNPEVLRMTAKADGFDDPSDFREWFTGQGHGASLSAVCIWFETVTWYNYMTIEREYDRSEKE